METVQTSKQTVDFQLKGGLHTITSIELNSNNLDHLNAWLQNKIKQAPKFFAEIPLVVDLRNLNLQEKNIDLQQLTVTLRQQNLIPIAIKNGNPEQMKQAKQLGLAIFADSKEQTTTSSSNKKQTDGEITGKDKKLQPNESSKLITQPVRSGQQIYAPDGDLVITSSVSHGAELLAAGHIHVYGSLRGRALAGINGDFSAKIFCNRLEAELISIAGHFLINEDINNTANWQKSVMISLHESRLQIETI